MAPATANSDASAALTAEADRIGAALALLTVRMEGRWWVLASSTAKLDGFQDPIELWGVSGEGPDAGRAPAAVCAALGRRPARRWVADIADSPQLRVAFYWTSDRKVGIEDLIAAKDRLRRSAQPAALPTRRDVKPEALAQIIEDLPVALIFFDGAGSSVGTNRAARRLLDLRPIDLTPRTAARRLEALGVRPAIPDAPTCDGTSPPLEVNGRHYAASAQAAHGPWGDGIVWRIEDVTQARQAEAKLEEAKRALLLAEVAGGIGHEFNNLLARVMGIAEDIQDDAGPGRISGLAETLIETAERGAQVVRRLMTYAGSVAPSLELVDPAALLRSWRGETGGGDVSLEADAAAPAVLVDPALLRACLDELLKNARQAASTAVAVGCRWEPSEQVLKLWVADNGSGMDATTRGRATQPFFTTRAVGEGVGLGLSMVTGALGQWGGRLTVASEPGKGTTVTLLLPTLGSGSVADL